MFWAKPVVQPVVVVGVIELMPWIVLVGRRLVRHTSSGIAPE